MSVRRLIRNGAIASSVLILLLFAMPILSASAACPGNVAVNPSFEEGFSERGGGSVTVANGWTPFWQDGPNKEDGQNHAPMYEAQDGQRFGYDNIREGNWSQKWWNRWATHHAGVHQQISVPAGSVVNASAWAQVWSSQKDDNKVSEDGEYYVSIGIDPTGGTDPNSPNVVYSERNGTLDQWVEVRTSAKAQAGTITVFLRGDAPWPVKYNVAYWDEACVTYVAPTPRPQPKATNTPAPTDTPEPTATPESTETLEPTATPLPTEAPVLGGISVYAFDDKSGNGMREAGEPLLSGARIDLTTLDGSAVASYVTTGSSEPYTFGDLEAGSYILVEQDPPGYGSTSPNHWAASIPAGGQLEIYFADRFEPSPTPTAKPKPTDVAAQPTIAPTAQPAAEPKSVGSLLGESFRRVSGILVAMLALVLPIVYRMLRDKA